MAHQTVLLQETLTALGLKAGDAVFEGTAGEGGLSREVALAIGKDGVLIQTDLDQEMLGRSKERLMGLEVRLIQEHSNFRNIIAILDKHKIAKLDAIVLDLGFASYHVDESGRGFTFQRDEPLNMNLNSDMKSNEAYGVDADGVDGIDGVTASVIINEWSEESLAQIFVGFGDEPRGARVAKAIVDRRKTTPITTTSALVGIINETLGERSGKINSATRIFQALRIAVNDELGALTQVLHDGWPRLESGGRLVVISFHEHEDRIVKGFQRELIKRGEAIRSDMKVVKPGFAEVKLNRRARSARLRKLTKI